MHHFLGGGLRKAIGFGLVPVDCAHAYLNRFSSEKLQFYSKSYICLVATKCRVLLVDAVGSSEDPAIADQGVATTWVVTVHVQFHLEGEMFRFGLGATDDRVPLHLL